MGILQRMRRWLFQPEAERRYHVLVDANESYRNVSGMTVNAETAMRVAAVHACCKILSESVAQLPLDVYRKRPDGSRKLALANPLYEVLHDRPNSWQTSFEWREQNMLYVLYNGNAVNEIKYVDGVVELHPIHPSRVRIEVTERDKLVYIVKNKNGQERRLLQEEVMHIRGPSVDGIIGLTPIQFVSATIGASLASDVHNASTWKNGARPGIVLETEQALPPNAIPEIRNQWEKLYAGAENSGKTAVLERGLKAHALGLSHTDLQFIEQQKMNATQIASVFRVPPHMIGLMDSATFSNIEHQQLSFVKMTLMPYLERWEQTIQRDLIGEPRYYAEFNVEGLLRGDTAARAAFYREMFNIGAINVDEIRRFENFNAVEGGNAHFVNMALNTLENAAKGVIPSAKDKQQPTAAQSDSQMPPSPDEMPDELDVRYFEERCGGKGGKPGPCPYAHAGKKKSKKRSKPRKLSVKAARAKKAHVLVDSRIQRYSEERNEPFLAKKLGGKSEPDNKPYDVLITKGGTHGIELKTMVVNGNNKITMKGSAQDRKIAWEKENNGTFHTVIYDDRKVYNAKGDGVHGDENDRQILYKRGGGSFRTDKMYRVKDHAELNKLIRSSDADLPEAARSTSQWKARQGAAS